MVESNRKRESIYAANAKLFAVYTKILLTDVIALVATFIIVIFIYYLFEGKIIILKLAKPGLESHIMSNNIDQLFLLWLLGSCISIFITRTIGLVRELREIKADREKKDQF